MYELMTKNRKAKEKTKSAAHVERRKGQSYRTLHDRRLFEIRKCRDKECCLGERRWTVVVFAECRKWFGAG